MACLAVAIYHQFGFSLAFLVSFIFVAALIVISFIDLDVRIVPDVISLPGIIAGLLFSVMAAISSMIRLNSFHRRSVR
jgi:leader peptidase (prepilin peptidase)/N-methyltransferase